jgi:hypothetical protein
MDVGTHDHILISETMANELKLSSPMYKTIMSGPHIGHSKHGHDVNYFNVFGLDYGNAVLPDEF